LSKKPYYATTDS